MPQLTATERSQIRRARKRRQKKKNRTRLILLLLVLLIAAVILAAVMILSDKTYQNEEEFQQYAEEFLADRKATQEVGELQELVQYGGSLSSAVTYPMLSKTETDQEVKSIVTKLQKDFEMKYAGATEEDKKALFVNYDSFETPKDAVSVVLHEAQQEHREKEMQTIETAEYAYNFSTKTGRILSSTQIFENDYRAFCSSYMNKYFNKEYGDKLVEGQYEKTLADHEDNFNNFSLTKDGVTFYFNEGTVVDKSEGPVAVSVEYEELDGVIRDQISERALDPNKPMVALTYDDGPFPGPSNRILDCLEEYGVVATFFELGQNVANYPEVLKREKELGMEIGSHSWSHPNMNTLSAEAIKEQLDKTNAAIKEATGEPSVVFRPPYGNNNANVQKYANAPVILWSVDTLDWKSKNADSVEAVVKGVENLDGKVVLMHSIYDSTAEATERLVPWLLEEGYQLVTVKELLQYKYNDKGENGNFYGYNYFYLDEDKASGEDDAEQTQGGESTGMGMNAPAEESIRR